MEITPNKLYEDKFWVNLDFGLASDEQKILLERVLNFYKELAVPDVSAGYADLESKTFFTRNKPVRQCVAFQAPLAEFQYQCRITISSFGPTTSVNCYKEILGDGIAFEPTHSPEARRRLLLSKLRHLDIMDRFSVVDKSADELHRYAVKIVQELIDIQPPIEFEM